MIHLLFVDDIGHADNCIPQIVDHKTCEVLNCVML